jgi:hypothetical protein
MAAYSKGLIKVVCPDMMCFLVRSDDLEPIGTATYDSYALCDPEPGLQVMDVSTWNCRCNELLIAAHRVVGHK